MKDQNKAEDIAAQRVQLLSPLLVHGLDPAKASQIKVALCEQTGLSERTLRRYLTRYRVEGFRGLQPRGKGKQVTNAIPTHLLEQAILLRREVPSRSVSQIIQILEWEGKSKPGQQDTDHFFQDDRRLEKTHLIEVHITDLIKLSSNTHFLPKDRNPNCHSCGKLLSPRTHRECNNCNNWLKCDCGSCGCDYIQTRPL